MILNRSTLQIGRRVATVMFACLYLMLGTGSVSLFYGLDHHPQPHPGLSATCSQHTCFCTGIGYCDQDCCCQAGASFDADEVRLVRCGAGTDETGPAVRLAPHMPPKMAVVERQLWLASFDYPERQFGRPKDRAEPPDKIPIP